MPGMLVPRWRVVPIGAWELVFAAVGSYFLVHCARFVAQRGVADDDDDTHHLSHYAVHMVMAGAMLYMFWLSSAAPAGLNMSLSMSGLHRVPGDPGLTLVLVIVLMGSVISQLDAMGRVTLASASLSVATAPRGSQPSTMVAAPQLWLAPRLETCCHIATCLAMGYMLVLMV